MPLDVLDKPQHNSELLAREFSVPPNFIKFISLVFERACRVQVMEVLTGLAGRTPGFVEAICALGGLGRCGESWRYSPVAEAAMAKAVWTEALSVT